MEHAKVLLIEDDVVDQMAFRRLVADKCLAGDYLIAGSVSQAKEIIARDPFDVIVSDYLLGDGTAFDILGMQPDCPVIVTTGAGDEEVAVRAMKAGAYDYLIKDPAHNYLKVLPVTIENAIKRKRTEERYGILKRRESEDAVMVAGPGFRETMQLIELASRSASSVLISGETGTGKNRAAKAIHYSGPTKNMPFTAINCAALPEGLVESELFGYRKGAFTGALADRKGLFELAEGGTLLLDEIGEVPLHLQSKLLGVIEEKEVRRIGGEAAKKVNVRVIAATSADIENSLGKTFRKDLYYRLSVIRIHIPPLRERKQDIPELCGYLLKEISGGREIALSGEELAALASYDWPGNIRELKNVLERAIILQGRDLRPSALLQQSPEACPPSRQAKSEVAILPLEEVEKNHIRQSLARLSGNVTQTAKALGISLSTLKRKIREYGLK